MLRATELAIYSVTQPERAFAMINRLAAAKYSMAQFQLAKFALFPPYEAVTRQDHLEPQRLYALDLEIRADPNAYLQ